MVKRLAISLAVCLAVGAVVSVGVAWGVGLRAKPRSQISTVVLCQFERTLGVTYEFRRYKGVDLAEVRLPPYPRVDVEDLSVASLRRSLEHTLANGVAGEGFVPPEVPSWLHFPGPEDGSVETWATAACGWPMRCLVSHRRGPEGQGVYLGALRLRSSARWPTDTLLLRPYWPGLTLNSLLYGGLPWFAWIGGRGLRRCRRIRRGACPDCGYDLRGSPEGCPECGLGRTTPAAA